MNLYRVKMQRQVHLIEDAEVFVEAQNEAEAKRKATEEVILEWTLHAAESDNPEVKGLEEVTTADELADMEKVA